MANQIVRTVQIQDANNTPVETLITNASSGTAAAANTVKVGANSGSILNSVSLNFINTISNIVTVNDKGDGNANIAIANKVTLIVPCSDLSTNLVSGSANVAYVRSPRAFTITGARASLLRAGNSGAVSGQTNVQVTVNGTNVFSTLLTIDNAAVTSVGSAVTPVITAGTVADDANIKYSIINAGGNAQGLIVTLTGI